MFGFIIPNFNTLSEQEKNRYQEVYCGLCNNLKSNYSNLARLTLSYDLTFLNILLNSLYEPKEKIDTCNCIFHPGKKLKISQTIVSDYCSDMTIALAYHKILDDIEDENLLRAKISERALHTQYVKLSSKYQKTCQNIEKLMKDISALEKSDKFDKADLISKSFGLILAEIFSYKNDVFANNLAKFGAYVGVLIYFMDAAVDLKKDFKSGNYNPYKAKIKSTESLNKKTVCEIKENLSVLAGMATQYFEKLPLVQDINILHNILYEGIWIKFNQCYKSLLC